MNLKKEFEKMNHEDLLWICKYMNVSCNSKHSNKKIISILLEPLSNKKYGMNSRPRKVPTSSRTKKEEEEEIRRYISDDINSRLDALTLKESLHPAKEREFKERLEALEKPIEEKQETKSSWWKFWN